MPENFFQTIIKNYNEQYRLYEQMLKLSEEQTNLLKANKLDDKLHENLQARSALMAEIVKLIQANKVIQENLLKSLKLNAFNFSELEKSGRLDEIQVLKSILAIIENILSKINENDKINESLIKLNIRKKQSRENTVKVSNIYKENMENYNSDKPN